MKVYVVLSIAFLFLIGFQFEASAHRHTGEPPSTQQSDSPTFESLVVTEQFTGKPARPVLAGREALKYRTVITEGSREGPNFAGHFTIVEWGCGGGCVQFAIVDAKTGRVFMPPFYVGPRAVAEGSDSEPEDPLKYQKDSKLLIVNGSRNEKGEGVYYYKWDMGKLTLIKSNDKNKT
jgi:hypothetical protein